MMNNDYNLSCSLLPIKVYLENPPSHIIQIDERVKKKESCNLNNQEKVPKEKYFSQKNFLRGGGEREREIEAIKKLNLNSQPCSS